MSDPNTSPVLPFNSEGRVAGARLCHFASGSSELLSGHKEWIEKHFVPAMKANPNGWVDFFAAASPNGNADKNLALSKLRLEAVERQIKLIHPGININIKKADGEGDAASFSTPPNNDGGYWRAVLVRWWGVSTPVSVPLYPADASDMMTRVYRLMPTVESWRASGGRVLDLAAGALKTTTSPLPEQKMALGLVDRVFKVTNHPGQTVAQSLKDIERIKSVFNEIKLLLQAITRGQRYLHQSNDPKHSADTAYTFPGHWKNKDPKDGIWYVKEKIQNATDEFVVDATMHEFAHFCGPFGVEAVGHAKIGGAPAYGDSALTLSKPDAMKNASSYAWLAYLARKPASQWLTAR